ncbi:hypothetical protein DID80_06040 [Candidatus Marinamargulisbacteria bacterium SCGC AAA071-K20]|nr:hypothetical protein DID80_06040 [Candidatus Marinamargulisbacteria bacterium SCGC AAA071-K20]
MDIPLTSTVSYFFAWQNGDFDTTDKPWTAANSAFGILGIEHYWGNEIKNNLLSPVKINSRRVFPK